MTAFVLRLPAIVAPFGPDQGNYATIGWGLSQGLTLYSDLWEMKPPGIYVTYALGMRVLGGGANAVFGLDYLAAALTVIAVIGAVRRLAGARMGLLAGAVVAIGTLPAARYAYGGFLERSVTETFIIPLATIGVWATVLWVDQARARWALAAGLVIGAASVYKPNAAIYWPAMVMWVWVTTDFARARRFASLSLAGLLVAPMVAFVWVWRIGALEDAWTALVRYNAAYLALGNQGVSGTLYRFAQEVWRRQRSDEVWAIGSLAAVAALVPAFRARATPSGRIASLGVIWLAAALIAVAANGPRLFTTYFQPPQIPLCLLAAWLLAWETGVRSQWQAVARVGLLVLVGVMFARSGSIARAHRSTSWDLQYIAGSISRDTYLERYRSQTTRAFSAADNARLAEYVASHTEPTDRIFVFGMSGGTYYASQRLPANRFLFAYPAVSNMGNRPEFRVETLAANLARVLPRYIILQRSNGDSFSGWKAAEGFAAPAIAAVLEKYREETEIGDFLLYRRID